MFRFKNPDAKGGESNMLPALQWSWSDPEIYYAHLLKIGNIEFYRGFVNKC